MIPSSSGKYNIHTVVTMPETEGKFPMVVMLHGTASDKNEVGNGYVRAAEKLKEAGFASVRFDFIGTGESEVDYQHYSFTSALRDVKDVVDYVKTLPQIDSERIGIMGWSQGGTITMLACAQMPELKSAVLWAGALNCFSMISEEEFATAQQQGYCTKHYEWRSSLNFGYQWMVEAKETVIEEKLPHCTLPMLAIAGTVDEVVDPQNAVTIAKLSGNENSTSLMIEGADHVFNVLNGTTKWLDQTIEATIDWFKKTL